MPPSKSSSKSGSRTTTRRPRKKKATPQDATAAEESGQGQDFGAGLEEDEAPVAVHTDVAESFDFDEMSDIETDEVDEPSSEPQQKGTTENPRSSGDEEEKPKKRRRRRRTRRGDNTQQQQHSSGRRKGQQQSRRTSGGRGSSGGGGRRVSKSEQNAAPLEPVQTSGTIEGVLELHPKGYGFLRSATNDFGARETDTFVSSSFVEKHNLREGLMITGEVGPGTRGQGPRLLEVKTIDDREPEEFEKIKHFDTLTPINPFEQIRLETGPQPVTMRVMDLLCPIGKGQRALIVAPPRTGKTMLLQDIANSVSVNHPEVHLIVLLIDERPEEVTEMRRNVKGDVIASSMDQDVESHVRISQLIFERGKRLAEAGKDCFILMDSITRTARAFNKWMRGDRNTKIQTGGLDVRALDIPRKMFGTARRFDEGGSLTVCATALIDTGSRMDEAIFQEFKGTGNMELVLSRDLADRRIWPALDISRSGTRREEKILDPAVLEGVTMLRRSLVSMNPTEAMDQLIRTLGKFESNSEFLGRIRQVL